MIDKNSGLSPEVIKCMLKFDRECGYENENEYKSCFQKGFEHECYQLLTEDDITILEHPE